MRFCSGHGCVGGTVARAAVLAGLAGLGVGVAGADPLTGAFVYQGRLNAGGVPASGVYDLRFRLYDAVSGGVQVGPTLCLDNTEVTDGQVGAVLDFGAVFDSRKFYLEVEVRADTGLDCSSGAGYDTLAPRQGLSAVPQASYSVAAGDSALLGGQGGSYYLNASNLTGTIADGRLSGVYSGAITLSNAGNSIAGSGAELTGLSATNVTAGTLPGARLAGVYAGALTFSNASNAFTGSGAGLTGLSATNLATGTVGDARLSANVAMRNAANAFGNFTNTFLGSVGVGTAAPNEKLEVKGTVVVRDVGNHPAVRVSPSTNGYGVNPEFVVQDTAGSNGSDSGFHLSRNAVWNGTAYNRTDIAQESSSLQFLANGDVGFYGAAAGANPISWTPSLYIDGTTGFIGVAMSTPGYPLNFPATPGDKVVVNGNSATPAGLGFQTALLQVHSGGPGGDIAFGYGPSATMTENVRFKGNGQVGMGVSAPGDTVLHVVGGPRGNAVIAENATAGAVAVTALSTGTTLAGAGGDFETDSTGGTGLYAFATATTGTTYGVRGYTNSSGTNAIGVRGEALRSGTNYGVYGAAAGATSFGVYANGRLGSSGTKSFMIDHPLDPTGKFLLHYSVESPEVLNVYTGVVTLDGAGEAWVVLPEYFASINTDPRYQLTSVGGPAPMLHVAEEVTGNRFKVAGGVPNGRVSWEVKAKRDDRFVREYGAPVELEKGDGERGLYLRPELYGQGAEMGQFRAGMVMRAAGAAR